MSTSPINTVDRHPAAAYLAVTTALSWSVRFPTLSAVEGPMLQLAPFATDAARIPTWTTDPPERRSNADATGVEA